MVATLVGVGTDPATVTAGNGVARAGRTVVHFFLIRVTAITAGCLIPLPLPQSPNCFPFFTLNRPLVTSIRLWRGTV